MANNLKALRNKRGLTMDQLAERMGTKKNMLVKLEGGTRGLDLAWIERAAAALGERPEAVIRERSQVPDEVLDALYGLDGQYLDRAIESIMTAKRMQEHGIPMPTIQRVQQPVLQEHGGGTNTVSSNQQNET